MKPQELESILNKDFSIDCPRIDLVPSREEPAKSQYAGAGSLTLSKEGYFKLKLYIGDQLPFQEVFERLNWESGKIISEDFYYNLTAKDISGRTWVAEGVLPERNTGPHGSIIIGKIKQISFCSELSIIKKNYLQIMFEGEIKVPLNTVVKTAKTVGDQIRTMSSSVCLANFISSEIDFEVEKRDGWTILTAISDSVLFDNITISRIVETFQFITAQTQSWSVMEIRRDNSQEFRVRANETYLNKSRVFSPISYSTIDPSNNVWILFDKFFSYIIKNKSESWHPVFSLVHAVIESGKSSIEVEALTLSVAIESLLRDSFSGINKNDDELISNISCVIKLIEHTNMLSSNFKKRLLGSINSMKNARAKDYLSILVNQNLLSEKLVKIYGKRRNKSAHGISIKWGDLQNFINQCSALLVLFYQLIFLRVGYTGLYTDYSTYNYPQKEFKPIWAEHGGSVDQGHSGPNEE